MNKLVRNPRFFPERALVPIVCMVLALGMGCRIPKAVQTEPESSARRPTIVTLQMVFDEAARGKNADLNRVKEYYTKVVTSTAKADALAEIYDGTKDYFHCKVLKLPASKQSSFVLTDFVGKVSNAEEILKKDCDGDKKSLEILLASNRSELNDSADDADDMINLVMTRVGDEQLEVAKDQAKIERVLDAVKNKGDETQLKKVFDIAPAAVKSHVESWSIANRANDKVEKVFRSSVTITPAMVLAAALGSDTAKLRVYYDAVITDTTSADNLATLAGGAPEFSVRLAELPANEDTLAIWIKHLGLVTDPDTELVRNTLAGAVAIDIMVSPARTVLDTHRYDVISVMADYADPVSNIGGMPKNLLPELFAAVTAKGGRTLLQRMFSASRNDAKPETIQWALQHKDDALIGGGVVQDAFIASARSDHKFDHDDVMLAVLEDADTVCFVYNAVVHDTATADSVAKAGKGVPEFSSLLAELSANAKTLELWEKHLYYVTDPVAELQNVSTKGVSAFNSMLDRKRVVPLENYINRLEIITEMVLADDGTAVAAITDSDKAAYLLEAMQVLGKHRHVLNRVVHHLNDAMMSEFTLWALQYRLHHVPDGGKLIRADAIFQEEYARVGRSAAGKAVMRNTFVNALYTQGRGYLITEVANYVKSGYAFPGNKLSRDIDLVQPHQSPAVLAAIIDRMENYGDDVIDAINNAGLLAVSQAAALRAVVAYAVHVVQYGIYSDYFIPADLAGNNFDPFGFGNATLLYSVLKQAETDLGALDHTAVNDDNSKNGLVYALKNTIGGVVNWQNYIKAKNNLPTNQAIEKHLVRPHAGSKAAARNWLRH